MPVVFHKEFLRAVGQVVVRLGRKWDCACDELGDPRHRRESEGDDVPVASLVVDLAVERAADGTKHWIRVSDWTKHMRHAGYSSREGVFYV